MVRNDGQIACSMVREGKWWLLDGSQLGDPAGLPGRPTGSAHAVDAFEPDVVYLLFGWPGVGGGRELDDGTVITPCEAGVDDRWRFEYQAMIRPVRGVGNRRVLVGGAARDSTIADQRSGDGLSECGVG